MEGKPGAILKDLDQTYERLFSGLSEESIPLVESFYKPWTQNLDCTLPFASATGLLMGDPALHLLEIYRQCGLDMSEEFKGCPDHLVLEMEFLSHLYRWGADIEAKQFIEDHLNWIPLLKEKFEQLHPHPFYRSLLEMLHFYLNMERKRSEMESHGSKSIH
jgi:TorA maturation chaperone TorD